MPGWLQNGCAVLPAPDREWRNRGLPGLEVGLPSWCFVAALEKGACMPVIIGVDPHKHSHTLAALDEHGRLLDRQRFPATLEGYQALRGWAERWDQRRYRDCARPGGFREDGFMIVLTEGTHRTMPDTPIDLRQHQIARPPQGGGRWLA